jgi:hypothetical protein
MSAGRRFQLPLAAEAVSDLAIPMVSAGFMVCPIPFQGVGSTHGTAQDIYRLAFERAVEATKPSRFELLHSVCLN